MKMSGGDRSEDVRDGGSGGSYVRHDDKSME